MTICGAGGLCILTYGHDGTHRWRDANATELRAEWHRLAERLDAIFAESQNTYWTDGGLQSLWRERASIHRRIAENCGYWRLFRRG